MHCWCVEGLKHDLGHLFSVGFGVYGSICEQNWVLLWCHMQLVVENMMPDLKMYTIAGYYSYYYSTIPSPFDPRQ